MSKLRHLCLGVSALSLLIMGIFSIQADAFAYAGCRNPHEIAAGENLSVIAANYNVTVGKLIEENGITNPDLISVGQVICIPNGAKKSSDSESVWSQPRYNDGWGDYGEPGESYDPALIGNGDGASSEYGPQAGGYSTVQVYRGVPGQSYDPAQLYAPVSEPTPIDDGENGDIGNTEPEPEG